MARRALVLLLTTAAAVLGPAGVARGVTAEKVPGELRVCGEGAITDVFIDRDELHEEKRSLAAGKCKRFALPKGKYAVTVTAFCENNRDAKLADVAVAPESRALFQDEYIAGARVVRESTTTFTTTWDCTGLAGTAEPSGGPTPFGDAAR
ncbi:hypothetical protein [Sporichthya sp.]|uniref:hypothetical protein n=1 Tax=Sporichthya sp. TaxID=65475 RepID=UPI00179A5CB9|nr:hypothetical protein [Sporichthya sp.]MBA3742063.1 hypothetical protein [Sporichthya sp.]